MRIMSGITHPNMAPVRIERCANGHPLTDEMIYEYPSGKQECRLCRWQYVRRHKGLDDDSSLWSPRFNKTHCPQGHPYDKDNTYVTPEGWRQCRTCKRKATEERRRRRLASGVKTDLGGWTCQYGHEDGALNKWGYAFCRTCKNKSKRASEAKRRALMASVDVNITPDQIDARYDYYGGRCYLCGEADADTMDHVIPLSKGGPHIASNLRPACRPCNSAKHIRSLEEVVA